MGESPSRQFINFFRFTVKRKRLGLLQRIVFGPGRPIYEYSVCWRCEACDAVGTASGDEVALDKKILSRHRDMSPSCQVSSIGRRSNYEREGI